MDQIAINIGAVLCDAAQSVSPTSLGCSDSSRLALVGWIALVLLGSLILGRIMLKRVGAA